MSHGRERLMGMYQGDALPDQNDAQETEATKDGG